MQCTVPVSVVVVGDSWIERVDGYRTAAEFARARVHHYGKSGFRIEVPDGATVPDDLLAPISGKRKLPKLRAAIEQALCSAVGTIIKTVELPPPKATPIAPSVPKPSKPAKVANPKVVKQPKPARIPTRRRTCGGCGENLPAERFYAHANGNPVSVCKGCFSERYTKQRKRSPPPQTNDHGVLCCRRWARCDVRDQYGGGERTSCDQN